MKHENAQAYIDYIFPIYLEFGTYCIQDKGMYETFEFGIKSLDDYLEAAKVIAAAVNQGHPHLDAHDIAWPAASACMEASKFLEKIWDEGGEEAFENFIDDKLVPILQVVEDENTRNTLFERLAEV